MSSLFAPPRTREFTASGAPQGGAKLWFYLAGTTTPTTVYQDPDRTIAHSNPVIADVGGLFPTIWLDPQVTYRVVMTTTLNATLWEVPEYAGSTLTGDLAGRAIWPQSALEAGASVVPTNYMFPPGDVRRYGADTTGVADSSSALNAPLSAGIPAYIPRGVFKHASPLQIRTGSVIYGEGPSATTVIYSGAGNAIGNATPGTRIYDVLIENLTLRATGGGVYGLSLDSVSTSIFNNLLIESFTTGVRCYSPVSGYSVYNRFYGVTTNGCTTGFLLDGTSSNAHTFYSCRFNGATKTGTVGWRIADSNGNQIIACHTDVAGKAVQLSANAAGLTDGNVIWANRIEDVTTAFDVGADVRHTHIGANYYVLATAVLADAGTNTMVYDPYYVTPGIKAAFATASSANGHIRYVRDVEGGSSLPFVVLRDSVTGSGTPVTLQLETERSSGSFLKGRRGGADYFDARADGSLAIRDGITAPSAVANMAIIYVDTADGDLKVRFGDGTIKTIVTDT
jgi:hypothetical protein